MKKPPSILAGDGPGGGPGNYLGGTTVFAGSFPLDKRDPQGNISCRELWRQAERFGISRMHMGYVVDRLAVKVRVCPTDKRLSGDLLHPVRTLLPASWHTRFEQHGHLPDRLLRRVRSDRRSTLRFWRRCRSGTWSRLAEQERIARDLHDLLGHTLSVIVVKAELARRIADRDPERAILEIGEVEQIAREALTKVRHAVEGYRITGGEGLELEFQNARRALDSAEVELEIDIGSEVDRLRLSPQQEAVLALALREAVTNVLRHACATSCRIDLVIEPDTARLEVRDDGRGGNEADGSGLSGMRKRVEALGGNRSACRVANEDGLFDVQL